ncbi:MAG: mechanosensitive ion channel family protein, partial [Magnetococcales bacterium]|nr:mechanosensitive ion channel family protein [Magnetococcales bacterium]
GSYDKGIIVSALTQLQSIRFLKGVRNLDEALESKKIIRIDDQYKYLTKVVHAGVRPLKISSFDPVELTFKMDFLLWFSYQGEFDVGGIEFLNAIDPIKISKPMKKKKVGDLHYELYQLEGEFNADFISTKARFGQHTLGLSFRHRDLTMNHLIFVADRHGMMLTDTKAALAQLKLDNVLSAASGWAIKRYHASQEAYKGATLGDPEQLGLAGDQVSFSRMNIALQIHEGRFSFRDVISPEVGQWLQWAAVLLLLALWWYGKHLKAKNLNTPPWTIPANALGLLVFLMTTELIWTALLSDSADPYLLDLLIKGFDVLWLWIPAILLVKSIKVFIWEPLEETTGRQAPILVRNIIAFIIYLLAFFGVIAFVLEYPLTGLLATSGVFAMIIGLAVQMNISNIFSGLAMNIERPFAIGDCVQIGSEGPAEVLDISWRTTSLASKFGYGIRIPNSSAAESTITNYSRIKPTCTMITVSVAPEYDPRLMTELMEKALSKCEKIATDDKHQMIKDWGPYGVMYAGITMEDRVSVSKYWVWYFVEEYFSRSGVADEVWRRVWETLTEEGIQPTLSPSGDFQLPMGMPMVNVK